jgi:hypothetical protein
MVGISIVAGESDSHLNTLSVHHQSSSDNDDELLAEEDVDKVDLVIASTCDADDDDTTTTNINNSKNTMKKKKSKKSTREVPYFVTCAENYEKNGYSKFVLLAMAAGVKDVGLDTNEEPYKTSKSRRSFVPSAKDLCAEI